MAAEADGVATICATPYIRHDHDVRIPELAPRVAALNAELARRKVKQERNKKDGPKYRPKNCPSCGLKLTEKNVKEMHLIEEVVAPDKVEGEVAPFIDGDDITRRYATPTP
jgi:hypothetical protein